MTAAVERLAVLGGAVLAAFVLVPFSVVVPFGGLWVGPLLALGGVALRRRSSGPTARAAGQAAVVLGLAILVLGLVLALAYSFGGGTEVDSGRG